AFWRDVSLRSDVVLEGHADLDAIAIVSHDFEVPREVPGLSMLGFRKGGKDPSVDHEPVVVEVSLVDPEGGSDGILVEHLVPGGLVHDGQNSPPVLGKHGDSDEIVL